MTSFSFPSMFNLYYALIRCYSNFKQEFVLSVKFNTLEANWASIFSFRKSHHIQTSSSHTAVSLPYFNECNQFCLLGPFGPLWGPMESLFEEVEHSLPYKSCSAPNN